jgi:hypothetical protein
MNPLTPAITADSLGPDLGALIQRAAGERPFPAWTRLAEFLLAGPGAWPRLFEALAACSPKALDAAGNWLFHAEHRRDIALRRSLAGHWDELFALARRRPGPWLLPGLAEVAGNRGGRALADLAAWARASEWGRRVVSYLPPSCRLPGGWEPGVWLARAELGPGRSGAVTRLARAGGWPRLAGMEPEAMTAAQAVAGCNGHAARSQPLAWPAGERALERLAELARVTAGEGVRAYELAQGLGRETGRPVILMGNAVLGGPPLWAAPGPWQAGWPAPAGEDLAKPPAAAAKELARMRARRLGGERLLRALWDLKVACGVAGRGREALGDLAVKAAAWLEPGELARLEGRGTVLFPGWALCPPGQRGRLGIPWRWWAAWRRADFGPSGWPGVLLIWPAITGAPWCCPGPTNSWLQP